MIQKPFDWIKEITLTKQPADKFSEAEWKLFEPFIIHRFLSMNAALLEFVDYIQRLNISNKKQLYTIYREFIPVDKKYYQYMKKITVKENDELTDILKGYFGISRSEMKDAMSILSKFTIEEILKKYGYSDKEIKKLVKGI